MKVDRSKVERNLPKKGFRSDRSKHHIYFFHEYKGKETGPKTRISHSPKFKDIYDDVLTSMRKQLRLDTKKETVDLINCPMEREDYNRILIQKNVFKP